MSGSIQNLTIDELIDGFADGSVPELEVGLALFEANKDRIRRFISWGYVLNAGLVEDAMHEIYLVISKRFVALPNDDERKKYKKYIRLWVKEGIRNLFQRNKGFLTKKPPKPEEIGGFDQIVKEHMKLYDCTFEEAKEAVRMDAAIKRGYILYQVEEPNEPEQSIDSSDWISVLSEVWKKISDIDRLLIRRAVDACFENLKKVMQPASMVRDLSVIYHVVYEQEKETIIADKHDTTPQNVTRLKKKYLPNMRDCVKGRIETRLIGA